VQKPLNHTAFGPGFQPAGLNCKPGRRSGKLAVKHLKPPQGESIMARTAIKRVKVTGWHTDKDTGDEIARLKITFEGREGARVSGKMHAYVSRAQMDEWASAVFEVEGREITLADLHDELYDWLFCD
jgi:hypothetical protein